MVVEGREAMRDLVAEGFGIGFAAEAEIVADSRLDKISISGDRLEMAETLACLMTRRDLPAIRAFSTRWRNLTRRRDEKLFDWKMMTVLLKSVTDVQYRFDIMTSLPSNILFIVFDQMRADALVGALADTADLPHFRALMDDAVTFTNHTSVTSPAVRRGHRC